MRINWHWPADPKTKRNSYAPWYVITWRLAWMPFIFVGILLAALGVFMSYGTGSATSFLRMTRP